MKVSETWLREWVNPPITTEELVAQLSMAGLEVDSAEPAAPEFDGVVIGEVLAVEQHPDADKLKVCQVSDGSDQYAVVCGAPNVTVGMKAPYARVGAILPGGMKIKKAKLRGVESFGMLCGPDELGLSEERYGLMELSPELETGADFRQALRLNDTLIDIDLTPNRGDCLGVRGLAREVGVLNDCEVCAPDVDAVPATIDDTFPITVSAPAGCPRYLGRVIKGVDVSRPTADWMVEKLRRCGLRSIDPVVDVTNYVLLELGQPMHAFDLREDTLLITDERGPVAMAGIMGGEHSGIEAEGDGRTTDIFLECAFFAPEAIAGRARSYGLQTDASHRYERGVDFDLQHLATERATRLLLDIVGGEAGPINEWVDEGSLPKRAAVTLRESRLKLLIGLEVDADDVDTMLRRLGLPVAERRQTEAGVEWDVTAPSWRFDIELEADLIEEVARIYGYDNVPVRLPDARMHLEPTHERRVGLPLMRRRLAEAGYQEVLTYAFVDEKLNDKFDPGRQALKLANPISSEMAVMRSTLWPGLVSTWIANRNRQQGRARLFETGRVFAPAGPGQLPTEYDRLAGLLAGPREAEAWTAGRDEVDFFDAKGDVERLVQLMRAPDTVRFERGEHPALHPGQTARVVHSVGTETVEIGLVGRLHPELQQLLDLPRPVYLFELDVEALTPRDMPVHKGVSRFPSVRRDIAIELASDVAYADIAATVRAAAGPLLTDVRAFDVFEGGRLEAGRKSVAIGLLFQDQSDTLKDETVNAAVEQVVAALTAQHGAIQR